MRTTMQGPGSTTEAVSSKTLVLLDFDGTITTHDTLIEFIRFYRGTRLFWWNMVRLAPIMSLYFLRIIPNWKAKQYFLAQHLKGEGIARFDERCREFSAERLPALIRPGARKAIEEYRRSNATIAVVSASAENWVKPWCDENGIICLATRLEVKDGRITGNFKGRNCYGDEKVCRIQEQFELHKFKRIIAYGDSSGDREMLALAHDKHYKPWR